MKITLLQTGKTEDKYLQEGISVYEKRLKRYCSYHTVTIPALKSTKNLDTEEQKKKEGERLLKQLGPNDALVLLDERGTVFSSKDFAGFIEKMQQQSRQVVFAVGGPYGFHEAVYRRAHTRISLSRLTFSHQMVRLFFTEQLYRAFTILRNEPYHHE